MSLSQPIPTPLLGIYKTGEYFQLRNLVTGQMIPMLYQYLENAMDAQRAMDWYNAPDIDVALRGEIDIAEALASEVRAWDEVIAGVTVNV